MKKYRFVIVLLTALFVFQGNSVWEGAAAVSSTDFPESGFYVATNSFPRNTIVDLTNLETGKTVRVIVASGLDTPGLLALVSREAAEEIGLRSRTIGRIRMTAPADPLASPRFSGEYRSGDPDYDPQAAVEEFYGKGAGAAENLSGGTSAVPPAVVVPPITPDSPLRNDPDGTWPKTEVGPVVESQPKPGPTVPAVTEKPPETQTVAKTPDPVKTPDVVKTPDIPETTDVIAMVGSTRDPVLMDLPVDTVPTPAMPVKEPPANVDPVSMVPDLPKPEIAAPPKVSPVVPPVEPRKGDSSVPEYNYTLIPAEERPPQGGRPSSPAAATVAPAVPQIFSVPAVAELESGKYYLQIGVYSQTAPVEQELSKIGRGYPLLIQCLGSSAKPLYRILVGPVNQGESGALLRSFRTKGYKDAFVRKGE